MCTFDIVPSLGPQSQVLHPAEASVFVQSSNPSTRSTLIPITSIGFSTTPLLKFPLEQSRTRHKCSSPITGAHRVVPNTQPPAPDPKVGERVRSPAVTYPQLLYMWRHLPARKDYTRYIFPYPNLTHIVAIAYTNNDKHGKQGIR